MDTHSGAFIPVWVSDNDKERDRDLSIISGDLVGNGGNCRDVDDLFDKLS